MSYFWNFAARKPRHTAAPTNQVSVEIERMPGCTPGKFKSYLCDVSRTGAQICGRVQVEAGESCDIHITSKDKTLDVVLPATVRWSRPSPQPGIFLTGLVFPVEAAYETLGELFLHGVLKADSSEVEIKSQ